MTEREPVPPEPWEGRAAMLRAAAHPRALPQVGLPWAPEPKPRAAEPLDLFSGGDDR